GEEGRRRSVVVVATSDVAALERLRAAQVATAYAEYFRDQGRSVMLLVDSVTRFARAQREVGLAAGEPPARRGYPPSVFAMLPRLLERTGQGERGSITAIYTVLVEGGDMDEPIADEVRGVLDGHVVLDRAIAARGRYPAVDVTVSLSRVMDEIVSKEHREAARKLRSLLGIYEAKRDLVMLGAYAKGSDKELDEAIAKMPKIEQLLRQNPQDRVAFSDTLALLGVGLLLGVRHATDADHVVAVAALASREKRAPVISKLGAMWGAGHMLTVFGVGGAIIALGLVVPPRVALAFE